MSQKTLPVRYYSEHEDQGQDFKMALFLKNVVFIDWQNHLITNGNLKVESGVDGSVEFVEDYPKDAVDCQGKIVTKSFVCAHHHAYSALARGMPFPEKNPENFVQILEYIWWNLDKKLDEDMIRASALATGLNCLKNGVTFIIDHHSSPNAIDDSLKILADVFEELGINHLLCYEMSARDGQACQEKGLAETERYLQKRQGLVGLHASFTVGDDLMKSASDLAEKYNSGIHIHVAEDLADQESCQKEYNMAVINRLENYGILDYSKTILGHCIHLDQSERTILANSKAWIAVNTESNLNNNVGLFSNEGGLEEKVLLGTDGMHSDMLRSAQYNYFTHKDRDALTVPDFYSRLRRAHAYLKTNDFHGDGDNNLVIFDYDSPTPVTSDNWLGHMFYGLTSNHVNSVIAKGEWVIRDRKLVKKTEEEILAFTHEQAIRLWDNLK
jgi:cytosine/adenosine deaminase-related metal-dependent hydrolase